MELAKLYKKENGVLSYWETWENAGKIVVHYGLVGDEGETEELKASKSSREKVLAAKQQKIAEGYEPFPEDGMAILLIEYNIDGMGSEADLEKRHNLQSRMDNTLGWTGLGHCDGGSTGSGTMEVCNIVVDFDVARKVIEEDLRDTEFGNFARIYREDE